MKPRALLFSTLGCASFMMVLLSCTKQVSQYMESLQMLAPNVQDSSSTESDLQAWEEREKELHDAIKLYGDIIAEKIDAAEKLGEYYTVLAMEYIRNQQWGLALRTLREALFIEPENGQLFYFAGLASGHMGNASVADAEEQRQFFEAAEQYLLRSIELLPGHENGLTALVILYLYDLPDLDRAVPIANRLLEVTGRTARTLMLHAHIASLQNRPIMAHDLYQEVIENTRDAALRDAAKVRIEELEVIR